MMKSKMMMASLMMSAHRELGATICEPLDYVETARPSGRKPSGVAAAKRAKKKRRAAK